MPATAIFIGEKATKLGRQWREHENDNCASVNTLFAVFGIASKCGRIADRFSFNNTPYAMWLDDIAYDNGVSCNERYSSLSAIPQATEAADMARYGLRRSGGRKVSMNENARRVLLRYLQRKIEFLTEIDQFLVLSGAHDLSRKRLQIKRHMSAIATVINEVSTVPA